MSLRDSAPHSVLDLTPNSSLNQNSLADNERNGHNFTHSTLPVSDGCLYPGLVGLRNSLLRTKSLFFYKSRGQNVIKSDLTQNITTFDVLFAEERQSIFYLLPRRTAADVVEPPRNIRSLCDEIHTTFRKQAPDWDMVVVGKSEFLTPVKP